MTPDEPLARQDARRFLDTCRQSSAATYQEFDALLAALDEPATRAAARRRLAAIERAFHEAVQGGETSAELHFQIGTLALGGEPGAGHDLTLLQFPSVFAPEEWSRTFFEGLARYSRDDFAGRTLAELGCGNGWIAIALARRTSPEKLYGLDINPRAISCARLNLYLNALSDDGEPIVDADGRSLLDRVEFHVSDLLAWVRDRGLTLDRVIGCIPQVLRPDLGDIRDPAHAASDEFLVSLSNYTGHQGYLEDLFGLGLVARAVEESIDVLRPGGWVVFNLGGRPGREILRQLFSRRGLAIREVWSTRIAQADDTDIGPLAEIERSGRHRFEFFLSVLSDDPVSARTAQAYARRGGAIYHALSVIEGRLRFPESMRPVFHALRGEEWRQVRAALDLDYEDDVLAEEKAAFLARLARLLPQRRAFPYGETAGEPAFLGRFGSYLSRYFAIEVERKNLLALPNRASALDNLLTLYAPSLALVHPALLDTAEIAAGIASDARTELLECPSRADLAGKVIAALRPGLIVTTFDDADARSPDAFLRLVEAAGQAGARLVVDLSPFFELDSRPRGNGVLQALSEQRLPPHVVILCGLVRNRVYRDLEVCLLWTTDDDLALALRNAAELSYSRVPFLAQEYYETILDGVLGFRLAAASPHAAPSAPDGPAHPAPGGVAARCGRAFAHPAVAVEGLPRSADTVRLDYGENVLPSPTLVAVSLFEAFARRELPEAESDPTAEIALLLRRRFGLDIGAGNLSGRLAPRFVYGLGVAPIFASLARACAEEGGTFVFPSGSYGHFVAAVDYFGAGRAAVATRRNHGFKIAAADLDATLARIDRPWLYLNGPVVNPTGSLYGGDEISELLAIAAKHRARVVLDTLFSGLEFGDLATWDLGAVFADHALSAAILGGVAKELAGGGLRFGYAWCHGERMASSIARGLSATPHATARFAARRIYAGLNRPTAETRAELSRQRRLLAERAERLAGVLAECGWDPLPPSGGLFLVARPTAYLGRTLSLATADGERTFALDADTIAEAMFWGVDLMINGERWTGLPEHCRFVYSVDDETFERGLERIRAFRALALEGTR